MTTKPKISDARYAAAKRTASAYEQQQAEEAQAARSAKFAPLHDLVNSDAFATVVKGITDLTQSGAFADENSIDIHLRAAAQVLPNLKNAAA